MDSAADQTVEDSPRPRWQAAAGSAVEPPRLRVIVLAYQQGLRIRPKVLRVTHALEQRGGSQQVAVDGELRTWAVVRTGCTSQVRVADYSHNGENSFARRRGIFKAHGWLVTFIHSDREISQTAGLLELYTADVVVGSKGHQPRGALRFVHLLAPRLLLRLLVLVRACNTLTGLKKMFSREVTGRLVEAVLAKPFACDLERLVARHFGYGRIIESSVEINCQFPSTTNLKVVFLVLWDTVVMYFRRHLLRWYDSTELGGAVS